MIREQVKNYCKKHLDKEYKDVCDQVFRDLQKDDPDVFIRGKAEVWSAAIVWAVGSANFLGDRSFEPYATLADVCSFFNANTSTVGQKAAKIRDILDINRFNTTYQTTSPVSDFINSLVMTPEGFIVPADMLEDDEDDDELEDDIPVEYLLILSSWKKVDNADLYQLEHLVKKSLSAESKLIKTERQDAMSVTISFFGTVADIDMLDKNLKGSKLSIARIFSTNPD